MDNKPSYKVKTLDDAKAAFDQGLVNSLKHNGYSPSDFGDSGTVHFRLAVHAFTRDPYRQADVDAQREHWSLRELARFSRGDYEPLCSAQSPLDYKLREYLDISHFLDINPEHFLHQSTETPGMVAFTPSAQYGEQDRQVRTSFGKYLKRYFGKALDDAQISELTRLYNVVTTPAEFKILTDPDEIEWAYENGPPSCMRRDRGHLSSHADPHPTQCYGSVPGWEADTGLAVLVKNEGVIARVIVNRKRQQYGRIYTMGGGEHQALIRHLEAAEYTESSTTLYRANIRALQNDDGAWLAPYVDGYGDAELVHDGAEHAYWKIGNGSYCVQNASGLVESSEYDHTCDDCGDEFNEDDGYYSRYHDEWICSDCIDRYQEVWVSRYDRDWIHEDAGLAVYEYCGELYTEYALERHNLVLCEDERVCSSDYVLIADDGTRFVDAEHAEDNDYYEVDGLWLHEDDTVTTFDGQRHAEGDCTRLANGLWAYDAEHEPIETENGLAAGFEEDSRLRLSHTLVRDVAREVCFIVTEPYVLNPHEIYVETLDDLERTLELEAA